MKLATVEELIASTLARIKEPDFIERVELRRQAELLRFSRYNKAKTSKTRSKRVKISRLPLESP